MGMETRRTLAYIPLSSNSPLDAKIQDDLPTAARFMSCTLTLLVELLAIEVHLPQPWQYRTVFHSHQAGPGSIRCTKHSTTSTSKPTTTTASPPASSSRQQSPSQRSSVNHQPLELL